MPYQSEPTCDVAAKAEAGLNLAYRWFCRLDLTDRGPDHWIFFQSRPSHGLLATPAVQYRAGFGAVLQKNILNQLRKQLAFAGHARLFINRGALRFDGANPCLSQCCNFSQRHAFQHKPSDLGFCVG